MGRWPTFGGVTVPKWIRLSGNMYRRIGRACVPIWAVGSRWLRCGHGSASGLLASWNHGGVVLWWRRDGIDLLVEVESVTDGGDRRLSEDAQDLDDHLRGVASDLGLPGIKKKRRPWKVTFLFLIFLMAAIGVLFAVIFQPDLFTSQSEPLDASGTESTVTDQGAASSESASDAEGSISGTWAMYWTNDAGSENQAFTITFTGTDTGTLEIHNDETESQTSFTVEGEKVEFEFTRTMSTDIDDVLEESSFLGTLAGADLIVGDWGRQDWKCWPDPNAGCRTTPNWDWYPSRLVRTSE